MPWGRALHRFMMPRYSPRLDADLQAQHQLLPLRIAKTHDLEPVKLHTKPS